MLFYNELYEKNLISDVLLLEIKIISIIERSNIRILSKKFFFLSTGLTLIFYPIESILASIKDIENRKRSNTLKTNIILKFV